MGRAGQPPIPPGATRLEVRLVATREGTRLELVHDGLEDTEAEKHAVGWPHFLARLVTRASGGDPGPDPWS